MQIQEAIRREDQSSVPGEERSGQPTGTISKKDIGSTKNYLISMWSLLTRSNWAMWLPITTSIQQESQIKCGYDSSGIMCHTTKDTV